MVALSSLSTPKILQSLSAVFLPIKYELSDHIEICRKSLIRTWTALSSLVSDSEKAKTTNDVQEQIFLLDQSTISQIVFSALDILLYNEKLNVFIFILIFMAQTMYKICLFTKAFPFSRIISTVEHKIDWEEYQNQRNEKRKEEGPCEIDLGGQY